MAATSSRWRAEARRVIAATLAALPADAGPAARRKALWAAYPFGSWEYHPYRMWCSEVRAALEAPGRPRPAAVDWTLAPPTWRPAYSVGVRCDHCDAGRSRTRGCLLCGPLVDALTDLLASPEFAGLLKTVRAAPADPLPRLVLADWLQDRGHDRLAELFRESAGEG